MTRSRVAALAVLVLCTFVVGPAFAHYKVAGEVDDPNGRWYFTGMAYEGRPSEGNRKDPVNIIFYGIDDGSPYNRDRIETHMDDDWSTRAVGGRGWSKDSDIWGICKEDQYVGWPAYPGSDSDKSDWHGSTSAPLTLPGLPTPTTKTGCFAQHHLRMWDDWEHTKVTSGHSRYDWAVGGFHHEHPVGKVCCVGHKVDRDWDRVRVEMTKGMRVHCSIRRWKYHPEADGVWQEYENSGYIARIALRHASQGCDGA